MTQEIYEELKEFDYELRKINKIKVLHPLTSTRRNKLLAIADKLGHPAKSKTCPPCIYNCIEWMAKEYCSYEPIEEPPKKERKRKNECKKEESAGSVTE